MNKENLQAVLFDLDGTLLDTAPDFVIAVNKQRKKHNMPNLDYNIIRSTVSHGARALVSLSFGIQEQDQSFNELRSELLQLYSEHLGDETKPFEGINDLLNWLDYQDMPWGIVTNKPRQYAEPLLKTLDLENRCHTLVCPDDVNQTKPHPEPMLLACSHINCEPTKTFYLGDHRRDIEAGRNAGMKTIAVNYGYISNDDPSNDWQADFYVNHASEIQDLLQSQLTNQI